METWETGRPWLDLYPADLDPTPPPATGSIVDAWARRVLSAPDGTAVRYFAGRMSASELDRAADAFAVELQHRDIRGGDRIGVYLQNVPSYPVALLGIWKAGAVAVPLNPMYRGRELRRLLDDSGTVGIVVARAAEQVVRAAVDGSSVRWLISASDAELPSSDGPQVPSSGDEPPSSIDGDLGDVVRSRDGSRPHPVHVDPDDVAFITYTSGTTGPPKGAMNTHRNYLESVGNYARWLTLTPRDVVYAIAPLFHITGLSLNAGIALLGGATLSMSGRFEPSVALETFREHGVTTTIGSITAFNAFFQVPEAGPEHFASVRLLYSGGAPIPPTTISAFRTRFGHDLHNIFGMTETTAGGIAVPPGRAAPVHEASGTLSVGVPMQNVDVFTIGPDGRRQPAGSEGELVFSAPQVIPGYWQNPAATETTLPGGLLHTGDVAVVDAEGWVYLVDRLKDQINTSGFKVWPREVEDVLYEHPAVFEAAVVGAPDDYRGEKVAAFVSLRDGAHVEPEELIAFARDRLAAYKRPREVHVLDALPKTATGKIQRAQLREQRKAAT